MIFTSPELWLKSQRAPEGGETLSRRASASLLRRPASDGPGCRDPLVAVRGLVGMSPEPDGHRPEEVVRLGHWESNNFLRGALSVIPSLPHFSCIPK